jgi:hypothetical protein
MNTVDSSGDSRTVNNAVRHKYRVLNDEEKLQMQEIKDIGAAFIKRLHDIGGTSGTHTHDRPRDLRLAQDHMEDAVMRAVRYITA